MAEIFQMARPDAAMRFTGERLTGTVSGQIEIEHLHRYFFAREMARGKVVLDIACGEGYGASLIAQTARSVVGMDVSSDAVAHASQSYRQDNLSFRVADARRIDADDDAFDMVASFETLEHFYEHEAFYAELRRVLRPGGLLLISTPDRDVYSPDGSIANGYHVRELTRAEFETGLGAVFPHVSILLQRPMIGSLILAANPSSSSVQGPFFDRRGPDRFEANGGLARALYLLAIASDQPVQSPFASAYIETSQLALREAEIERRFAAQQAASDRLLLETQNETERRVIAERSQVEHRMIVKQVEMERRLAKSEAISAQHNQAMSRLAGEAAAMQATLNYMLSSKSWKLTAPLRSLLRRLRPIDPNAPAPPLAEVAAQHVAGGAAPANLVAPEVPRGASAAETLRQRLALGVDLPQPTLNIAVGIVTYNTDAATLERCLSSVDQARSRGGLSGPTLIIDNGAESVVWRGSVRLNSQGNIGFGAAHNVMMGEAFARGSDVYVAVNPDGALHPDGLERLARVIVAHDGRALVEAIQFPAEHPKDYDPLTLETAWASGACLAIPRAVFDATQGFDRSFFMYCEDVDLSWRTRAAGMKVLTAPHALFLHPVTNRTGTQAMWIMMLESAVLLGRKWGNDAFAEDAARKLSELGVPVPDTYPPLVQEGWRSIPDFSRNFSFSPVRW